MNIGVSTASLYPMNTEEALLFLAEQGIKNVEVFINCDIEIQNPLREKIKKIIGDFSLNTLSIHPVAVLDTFFLFSNYDRRLEQYMEKSKCYFDCMNHWGAEFFVFHGLKIDSPKHEEFYFERYLQLVELGESFGVTVTQENIVYCKSGNLEFLKNMKKALGDKAKFTFDLKQAVRSGYSVFNFLETLGKSIVHIHASDNGKAGDCLPIGKGEIDFVKFFDILKKIDYNKGMVLELYSDSYDDLSELRQSTEKLENIYKSKFNV